MLEFAGETFTVSPHWPKVSARFAWQPTELPPGYAEALRAAEEQAMEREIASISHAKRLLFNALMFEAARSGRELEVDDCNRELFAALAGWLAKSDMGFDPKKGIALLGHVGTGKTFIMRAVRKALEWLNSGRVFSINPCTLVFDDVKSDQDALRQFKSEHRCFDDLGEENAVLVDYGNRTEVMREVLSARHRKFEASGLLTHITTNRTLDQLKEQYGSRVDDRLTQMCNIYELGGNSRRK